MKKNIYLVFSAVMLFPLMTSAMNVEVGGIHFSLNETDLTAEATGLADSTITDLVIPASITVEGKEYQVQSIGNNAFNNNHFSSITLSEGLKTIVLPMCTK